MNFSDSSFPYCHVWIKNVLTGTCSAVRQAFSCVLGSAGRGYHELLTVISSNMLALCIQLDGLIETVILSSR